MGGKSQTGGIDACTFEGQGGPFLAQGEEGHSLGIMRERWSERKVNKHSKFGKYVFGLRDSEDASINS